MESKGNTPGSTEKGTGASRVIFKMQAIVLVFKQYLRYIEGNIVSKEDICVNCL